MNLFDSTSKFDQFASLMSDNPANEYDWKVPLLCSTANNISLSLIFDLVLDIRTIHGFFAIWCCSVLGRKFVAE